MDSLKLIPFKNLLFRTYSRHPGFFADSFHTLAHNKLPLKQINSAPTQLSYLFKIYFNITLESTLRPSNKFLSYNFF
jgi:prephenate dehydratase